MLFPLDEMPFPTKAAQVNSFPLTLEDSVTRPGGLLDSESLTLLPMIPRPN